MGRGSSGSKKNAGIALLQGRVSYERINRNLWQYPGEQDRTDRLITTASRAFSANQINRAYTALKNHDQHLTMLIERASSEDVQGDVRLLMSMRRRVRQAMRTVSRQL